MEPDAAADKMAAAGVTFERALEALGAQADALEQGELGLEEGIAVYAFGAQLRRFCERRLREAEMKIERLTVSGGKATGAEPFES